MNLSPPVGAIRNRKVLGRGSGSGKGCTSGRGNKGQKSRAGFSRQIGFEGGQMPLARRIPKRGFNNNTFERAFQIVNVRDLERYKDGDRVDYDVMLKDRLITKKCRFIKLLGKGELTKKIHVVVNKVSAGAVKTVEKAGGKVELIT